ncbi:chitotriosidase-1 isoform X1, partial [Brachionus plicatilis]
MTIAVIRKSKSYFTNWAQSRPSGAEFYPEDIHPELCTHIIYAFAKIENYTIAPTEAIDIEIDDGFGLYERIMVLRIINPALKILLAVGGWAQGSAGFDTVVENDGTMKTFAKNSINFLRKWEFDGLDVDWEFPVVKKKQFTRLLEILRTEFDNETPKNKTLELSIAVSGGQATIDTSYEVDKISRYVDFVNLMAYDFHGSWSIKTGFHSALYSKSGDLSWENTLNVDWSVNYWLKKGCPREKLILGIAFYGRGFKLANSQSNKVGSPSRGSSRAGKFTQEAGFLSFYEICQIKKEKNLAEEFDNELGVPGLTFDNQWIGYENQESVILKASYIKDMCLGGAMVWTIDFDDFKGTFCDEGTYPLMTILNEVLKDSECYESIIKQEIASSTEPVTTVAPVRMPVTEETLTSETIQFETTTQFVETEASTQKSVTNDSNKCNGTTLIPSFIGCEFYQVCLKGFENPAAILKCPANLWFDKIQQTCTKNKPATCETEIESATLIPMISPDTSVFAYTTQSVTELPNTTEHYITQDNDDTTQILFATHAPFLSTDKQQNDIKNPANNTTANTLANTTVMAYATSEQKSTSIDQENEDNTLANTTVMAYVTSEQKSTSIDQENEDNTLANTT